MKPSAAQVARALEMTKHSAESGLTAGIRAAGPRSGEGSAVTHVWGKADPWSFLSQEDPRTTRPGVTQPSVEPQEMATALMPCDVSPSSQCGAIEGVAAFSRSIMHLLAR